MPAIKTHELLRLYEAALSKKAICATRMRQAKDEAARTYYDHRWNRADRIARKLQLALHERLRGIHTFKDGTPVEFCGRCGWAVEVCDCGDKALPHIPDTPAMLVEELVLDTAAIDLYDLIGLFKELLDGTCLICGDSVGGNHLICANCAGDEALKWAGWGGMLRIGDLAL